MMPDNELLDTALRWHAKLASPQATASDWAEFTDWLEADPENGAAYDRVVLADHAYDEALAISAPPPVMAQNDNEPEAWYRRKTLFAVAASVALALVAGPLILNNRDLQTIQTGPGENREIALGDGTLVALNGSSKIEIDMEGKRFARLAEGEALFSIKHDPNRPFTVEVDDHTLVDVGTEFNVRQDKDGIEVAVSDGAVEFNPDDAALVVRAGNQVKVARNSAKPILSKTETTSVGGWRKGRLAYSDVPLSRIAADLSRLLGVPVTADPMVSNRRFSGLIQIDGNRDQSMRRMQPLLGVTVRRNDKGWVLSN